MSIDPKRFVAVVAFAALLSACGSNSTDENPAAAETQSSAAESGFSHDDEGQDDDNIPTTAVLDAHEEDGLKVLRDRADLVVVGKVSAIREGVKIGEDTSVSYTVLTIQPSQVVSGNADASKAVEVAMMASTGDLKLNVPGRPIPKVGATGIWFLTTIDPMFKVPGYVLTNTGSEILFDQSGRFVNHGPAKALEEAEELGSRDAILAELSTN